MSGLSRSDSGVGPAELKSARVLPPDASGLVTAATVIALSAVPGEISDPPPNSSKSFPAATTGTTPAAAAASSARATMSRDGSISGSPSERLITSMPSDTAASIAATSLRRVAVEAHVRVGRDAQRLVVADVGPRRDARDLDAAGGGGAGVAGSDPRDMGRVPGLDGSKGLRAYFHVMPAGANARATITLAVVYAAWPFGKPAGIV